MFSNKVKTEETFITPDQFDEFTRNGYVVFMSKPTAFGTYKAVRISLVKG